MRRRLLAALAAGPFLSPPSRGQSSRRLHRIALLGVATPSAYARQLAAFRLGLRELGYVEGANIATEERWAAGYAARLPQLAADLVATRPDVIVTSGPGSRAALGATSTIPIVMAATGDAVASGLVASLARPGGNVTGSSFFVAELHAKRLELLKEALPRMARAGLLLSRGGAANPGIVLACEDAARRVGVGVRVVETASPPDYASALRELGGGSVDAVVVSDATVFVADASEIAQHARRLALPSIGSPEYAQAGGLVGYGVSFPSLWHRAASFVDRILRGARPGDIPIEQPTRFELVVNGRAAASLGLSIPPSLLQRVDDVLR